MALCGGVKKQDSASKSPAAQARESASDRQPCNKYLEICDRFPVREPRIVFRMDSRPIALALADGYEPTKGGNPSVTEGGENQGMVGGAVNFVGSYNYKGYAMANAHSATKKQWRENGYRTFYWTACVIREGGCTYEWLLDMLTPDDRAEMRELVLTRLDAKADKRLFAIAEKYSFQGINNIGTTEIVTTKIAPDDILGYFAIHEGTDLPDGVRPVDRFHANKDPRTMSLPDEDVARFRAFVATEGVLDPPSRFV